MYCVQRTLPTIYGIIKQIVKYLIILKASTFCFCCCFYCFSPLFFSRIHRRSCRCRRRFAFCFCLNLLHYKLMSWIFFNTTYLCKRDVTHKTVERYIAAAAAVAATKKKESALTTTCVVSKYRMRALVPFTFPRIWDCELHFVIVNIQRGWNPNPMLSTRQFHAVDSYGTKYTEKNVHSVIYDFHNKILHIALFHISYAVHFKMPIYSKWDTMDFVSVKVFLFSARAAHRMLNRLHWIMANIYAVCIHIHVDVWMQCNAMQSIYIHKMKSNVESMLCTQITWNSMNYHPDTDVDR